MDTNVFEPADYSLEELAFMRAHLRETPNVALDDAPPKGVNPVAIRSCLGRLSELDEIRRLKKREWGISHDGEKRGYEAVEDAIDRFIAWQEQCVEYQGRGGPRHPSMKTWDSTGAMSPGGIGSDSEKIRHEIRDSGQRVPFAVVLIDNGQRRKVDMPWTKRNAPTSQDAITYDNGVYHCSVCDKPITSFDTARGRSAQNKAKSIVRRHLKAAKNEVTRHRALVNVPIP